MDGRFFLFRLTVRALTRSALRIVVIFLFVIRLVLLLVGEIAVLHLIDVLLVRVQLLDLVPQRLDH